MGFFWICFIIESFLLSFTLDTNYSALSDVFYLTLTFVNVFILIGSAGNGRYIRTQKTRNYYILGIFIRLAFFIWVQYFSDVLLLPNAGYDEYTFYYNAVHALRVGARVDSYSTIVAAEARFVGLSLFYLRIINLYISMQSILVFSKILEVLVVSDNTYDKIMFFACCLPSFALISILLLRESLIIFLLSISLLLFLKWWKGNGFLNIILAVGFSFAASWLHSGAIVIAAGEIIVFILSKKEGFERSFYLDFKRSILIFGMMAVMLYFISVFGAVFGVDSVSDVYSASNVRVDGGSGYNANLIPIGGPLGIIINSPFHAIFFLGSPFPWQWRSLSDILAFSISAVFYLYVFWQTIKRIRLRDSYSALLNAMFIIAIIGMIVFGWGVSNAGTALRHREKLLFVFLIMLALIQEQNLEERLSG